MKHIAILNPKGGCGKTTIATHLAVYASTLGLHVAIADHDEQRSTLDWKQARPHRCVDLDVIAAFKGDKINQEYDIVVHDMPAGAANLSEVLGSCSKVIVPLMPSPIDLKAVLQLWVHLSEQGWLDKQNIEFAIVANRVKSNTKYLQTFDEFVEKLEIPKIATLRDTQNYIRAMDDGLTLFDLPPGRVVKDLVQWEPIMDWSGFLEMDDDLDEFMLGLAQQSSETFLSNKQDQRRVVVEELDEKLDQQLMQAINSLSASATSAPAESIATGSAKGVESRLNENSDGASRWLAENGELAEEEQEFISLDDYQAEQLEEEAESFENSDLY